MVKDPSDETTVERRRCSFCSCNSTERVVDGAVLCNPSYQNGDGVATKSYVGPISTSSYRLKIVVRVLSSTFLLSLVAFAFRQGYLEMSSGSRRSEVSKGSFSSQLHKF